MAANGGDARSKRAQARGERRAKASHKQEQQGQQEQQAEEPRNEQEQGGNGGGTLLSTPKLVAAGAAAGALLGTAKAVLDRRQGHGEEPVDQAYDEHEEFDDGDDQEDAGEQEPRGRSGGGSQTSQSPSGLRGMLVSVLEAALEAVQEPGQARQERQASDDEGTGEEEEDDEEAEREPRGEQSDERRPTARGESGQAGGSEEEGPGPAEAGAAAADGGEGSAAEEEEELSPQPTATAEDDAEDAGEGEGEEEPEVVAERGGDADYEDEDEDEDEEQPAARVGERDLGDDAQPIVAGNNGHATTAEVLARAREQIALLVGRAPESTSRVEHVEGGWRLAFEVVEVPRIPPTTDVLASYSVAVDESGNVLEYGRTRRYYRNRAEEGGLE